VLVIRDLRHQQVPAHHDHGQQIVEVVRDPAGEARDRFHPLQLPYLLLQPPVLGHIAHRPD